MRRLRVSELELPRVADVGAIAVRELTAGDRAALAFALRHLGERSRYQRYLTGMPDLTGRELARLLAVDHWHHEVLIALHSPPRIPVGVAEYVRGEDFESAELAVAVADDWQHHGVGAALAEEIAHRARAAGIRRFTATLLRDNQAALALLRRLGEVERVRSDGPVMELAVTLADD
jgi:GNAT superfamily N-acetyltransferase